MPITSTQDAQSSGDEDDADEDMEGDEEDGAMQCQDVPGDGAQHQMPMKGMHSGHESGAGGSRQKPAPVVDDDGFQLVQRGRRR